jgi:hypothetical protein
LTQPIGTLGKRSGPIEIVSVVEGGPAAAAGLRAGDRVVAVDDRPLAPGATPDDVAGLLLGRLDEILSVTVERVAGGDAGGGSGAGGAARRTVSLRRAELRDAGEATVRVVVGEDGRKMGVMTLRAPCHALPRYSSLQRTIFAALHLPAAHHFCRATAPGIAPFLPRYSSLQRTIFAALQLPAAHHFCRAAAPGSAPFLPRYSSWQRTIVAALQLPAAHHSGRGSQSGDIRRRRRWHAYSPALPIMLDTPC